MRGADRTGRDPRLALGEATALAVALPGLDVRGSEVVRLPRPHPGTLFGSGKVEEMRGRLEAAEIELVMIDGTVTPVQQRNLERAWKVKILDRTALILEIFADRAATREGVLQVDLAALEYQRTRLVRAWTHLERQRGGSGGVGGFVGGPGETQIEADRRAIDDQILRIRRQLEKVTRTRELHRAARAKVPYPVVAFVGYTNAGKSTLFNRLTGAEVIAKDMLFATLDPTMRSVRLDGGLDVILSDTVGFISDLPTQLVAAFRATLEEVLEADLILHVRDVAHPESERQARDVESVLEALGVGAAGEAGSVPRLELWNKVDALDAQARGTLANLAERRADVHLGSAATGEGLDALMGHVSAELTADLRDEAVAIPFADGAARAWLHEAGVVAGETADDDGHRLALRWTARQREAFRRDHPDRLTLEAAPPEAAPAASVRWEP